MDNDAGVDTNDSAGNMPHRLPLGEQEQFGAAIANEKLIREMGKILMSLGDLDVEAGQEEKNSEAKQRELKRSVSVTDYFSNCTQKVFETLGIVLGWLEQSSKKTKEEDKTDGPTVSLQKKESVLRGLFHITGLGSYTCFVDLLELASNILDLHENLYKAKREHVKECLKEAEEQKQKVDQLVETACDLLQQITREPEFDQRKADEFNSTVQQANVFIESCKDFLHEAEKTIDELMKIMDIVKIVSRGFRFAGLGVTCYVLYHMIPSTSTVDSLKDSLAAYVPETSLALMRRLVLNPGVKTIGFAASCSAAGYAWLSWLPSKADAFWQDLEELKSKHKRVTLALHRVEKRLKIVNEDFQEKAKKWSNRGDSV